MDKPIAATRPADAQPSSGRAAVLHARAMAELIDLANILYRRHVDPLDIFVALHDRSGLLAEAHELLVMPVTEIVQALPGLRSWDPAEAARKHCEATLTKWRRRHLVISDWFKRHAGEAVAERKAIVIEDHTAAELEAAL